MSKPARVRVPANVRLYDINGKECGLTKSDTVFRDVGVDGLFHCFQTPSGTILKALKADIPPPPPAVDPMTAEYQRGMREERLMGPATHDEFGEPIPQLDVKGLNPVQRLTAELMHEREPAAAVEYANKIRNPAPAPTPSEAPENPIAAIVHAVRGLR